MKKETETSAISSNNDENKRTLKSDLVENKERKVNSYFCELVASAGLKGRRE